MSMATRSKRLPEIYGKYQFDPKFRHASAQISRAIWGMCEQDVRDAIIMAEKLNHWESLGESGRIFFKSELDTRDAVMRGVQ